MLNKTIVTVALVASLAISSAAPAHAWSLSSFFQSVYQTIRPVTSGPMYNSTVPYTTARYGVQNLPYATRVEIGRAVKAGAKLPPGLRSRTGGFIGQVNINGKILPGHPMDNNNYGMTWNGTSFSR